MELFIRQFHTILILDALQYILIFDRSVFHPDASFSSIFYTEFNQQNYIQNLFLF